ncbi:hypothetical protein [Achromobacter anxifer]|uniref:hypothetical protein n=1 Tax=Achromobacter anxifer TaxID=1287737 RepID=UPI0023F9B509|nr:hypothetical protein [Achromobacter anxifer]MDF8361941.1 hypothetical protein [Achromobacter anxifer]
MAVASYILPRFKAIDDFGRPMVGAKLYTYQNKTTTPAATYQDAQQSAANTNPIVLNASGEAIIYLITDQVYTFVLKDANDVSVWSQDDVTGAASPTDVEAAIDRFAEKLADPTNTDLGAALVGGVNRVVDTVADVRKQRGIKNPYVVATGYYARNDKQPSFYVYDPADSSTADNGFTVLVSQYGDRYKLNHPGAVSIDEAGAKGDGVTDDSARIQAAFDWASTTGIPLRASARTYGLKLSQRIALEGSNQTYCALIYKTRVKLHGAGMGATVFKLLDNESTDASPKWFNLMAANTVLDYVEIFDMTFDINGQNNKINPDRASGVFNGYNCAALMVSGSVASVGVDARMNNFNIVRIEVINSPGVTCIATGSRYQNPGVSGRNGFIGHCRFYNNGLDSQDHSSIFAFGDGITVFDCSFDHPTPSTGRFGPVVAVELHGSDNTMTSCRVRNYNQGAWISCGEDGERKNNSVWNNDITVNFVGVASFSSDVWNDGLSNTAVFENRIHVTADVIVNPHMLGTRYGIFMALSHGANLFRTTVGNNTLYCTDRSDNAGIVYGADNGAVAMEVYDSGNHVSGFSRGIIAAGTGTGRLASFNSEGSTVVNCAPTTAISASNTRGMIVSGTNFSVSIQNFSAGSGDLLTAPNIALEVTGTATNLEIGEIDSKDCPVGVQDSMVVSGRRTGRTARTFTALPAQSTWKAGDIAYLAVPSEAGVAGSKVMTNGWRRITNGVGNVLNTDWLEIRTLTGN